MTAPPKLSRVAFQRLAVLDVEPLTADSVVVTFDVPPSQRPAFAFRAGQHLTVRRDDLRRSYSICSTPAELATAGLVRIGVRQIPGGAFSSFAVADLRPGDEIDVLPPLGHFTTAFAADRSRHYAAVAAGSGITPVLSLVATALDVEPGSRCTVLYGNRATGTVMFAEELADLKNRYPTRLQLIHVMSREAQESELLTGRLDAERIGRILDTLLPADAVDEWFLCGPHGMVLDAQAALSLRGVTDEQVHTELFHVADAFAPPPAAVTSPDVTAAIVLDGRTSTFDMAHDERILDAALRQRPELPYACKGGVCSTCRAKLVEGEVTMARNFALEPDEVAAGYILTCQAMPTTERVVVDYDA